ncbi:hypothetical protein [Bradyrhizobium sp. WSM4349]|uniref:hypothetical protein n=1 Tax=Bradyrhizobium sp. WSM4349 TaxID=1040988 RepID=UPI00037E82D3|nr:hypothetical protein [Bradyrhizobium sp. WSM4349]
MTELVRYEAARRALAEAVAVDEVLDVRSKADAMRHYARQAGDRDLEIQSAQLRFRAERRLGEMLAKQKETVGLNAGTRGQLKGKTDSGAAVTEGPDDERPTLAEVGITHKLSSKAQRIAAMDVAEFEQALARHAEEVRAGQGRVAMDLHKIGAEERGRAHRRNLAAVLSEQSAELPAGPMVPAVYLDPPWRRQGGIGDRAYENHYPTMTWPEILDYLRQVAPRLLPDSWAFMWIPRPHLLALVEIELEVMVKATGEITPALLEVPLGWACGQALGMDSYSTCYVWTKTDEAHPDVSGSGLLVWDQDELLLQFKRGRGLPKPSGWEKFGSNHRERATDHSRKPEHYRRMIASMVGCDDDGRPLPVLELFARVDAEHPLPPGWIASGNQAAASAIEDSSFAAGSPSDAGETVTAAADATERASPAAAVADVTDVVCGPAPYDAGDVIQIDQLAGSDYLRPAELDALELAEREQLEILSDFCHKQRVLADVLGPRWRARELAYETNGQWRLRPAGADLLRELQAADRAPPAPVEMTEPYRAPQPDLFAQVDDRPAPEVIDGRLQTRLPVDDDETAEQLALLAVDAGDNVEPEMLRHLVGKGLAHCGTNKVKLTDDVRAFLAQLVAPASVQQQGETAR